MMAAAAAVQAAKVHEENKASEGGSPSTSGPITSDLMPRTERDRDKKQPLLTGKKTPAPVPGSDPVPLTTGTTTEQTADEKTGKKKKVARLGGLGASTGRSILGPPVVTRRTLLG